MQLKAGFATENPCENTGIISTMKCGKFIMLCLLFAPMPLSAEWQVITHTDTDNDTRTEVAYSTNDEGYSTEIYQDSKGVVRLRFSMNQNRHRLDPDSCPTYQVDKKEPRNRSINDAGCIGHNKWVEYVLGYLIDDQINSGLLVNIMQGNNIYYRFRLKHGGYAETTFSLSGSRNALRKALGEHLDIVANR